ncbi:DNA primase [Listeria costaricensis]|uniref:DNA primase n=1 Tax=Listeria costaricensis TaxID=2026604 RepID=UPI000C088D79|nr:DNA primase [Listeria costaricensis]
MRRIPEETIDAIRSQADIVDVISNYVQLKKQGRNYIGLCPFHGEKTPSFSVSAEKQIFHCFGCGKGGNVFRFLMEHDNLTFVEAVQKVAEMSHIDVELPEIQTQNDAPVTKESSETHQMIEMHQLTAKLYHYLLMETEEGSAALAYLKERGMSEEMMTAFQIGFAPNHHATIASFLEKRGMELELAVTAGLLTKRESGEIVDRFRGRIMFPITNDRGQLVGFSGRLYEQRDGPKYLNSPETPIFNKRRLLYHFSEGRQAIRKKEEILLLEGFMDVISTTEADLENGIASMGTSLTEEHIELIRRVTNRAVICYDGDNAGIEAAYKAGTLIQDRSRMEVFVVQLPGGKDPDEFIKANGADKFREIYQHERMSWTAFMLQFLRRGKNLQNETEQLQYLDGALAVIARLGQAVEREIYLKQLAEEFSLSMETLKEELQSAVRKVQHAKKAPARQQAQRNERMELDESFMGMIPPDDAFAGAEFGGEAPMMVQAPLQFHKPVRKLEAHTFSEQQLMKAMLESRDAFAQIQHLLGDLSFYHDDFQALFTYLISFYLEDHDADIQRFMDFLPDEQTNLKNLVASLEMIDAPDEQGLHEYQAYILSLKKFKLENRIKQLEQAQHTHIRNQENEQALEVTAEILLLRKKLASHDYDLEE